MKKLKYLLEYIFVKSLYLVLGKVSIETASSIGSVLGKIAYLIPHKSKRFARVNLRTAFPNISEKETNVIIKKMWDNICRSLCETPSVYKLSSQEVRSRVKINCPTNFVELQKNKAVICVTGHFGNWDITARALKQNKDNISIIYRDANNAKINQLYVSNRSAFNNIQKGTMGLKKVFKSIKNKDTICFFGDQKLNNGIPVDFFGKKAMTPSAPMKIALKFDLPIFFAYSVRKNKTTFETNCEGPYTIKELLKNSKDSSDKELQLTKIMNKKIESWIKKHPTQWFWVHRRWEKSFYE